MGRLLLTIRGLPFFSQLVNKEPDPFRFCILVAEVQVVPEPLDIILPLVVWDRAPCEDNQKTDENVLGIIS